MDYFQGLARVFRKDISSRVSIEPRLRIGDRQLTVWPQICQA